MQTIERCVEHLVEHIIAARDQHRREHPDNNIPNQLAVYVPFSNGDCENNAGQDEDLLDAMVEPKYPYMGL